MTNGHGYRCTIGVWADIPRGNFLDLLLFKLLSSQPSQMTADRLLTAALAGYSVTRLRSRHHHITAWTTGLSLLCYFHDFYWRRDGGITVLRCLASALHIPCGQDNGGSDDV